MSCFIVFCWVRSEAAGSFLRRDMAQREKWASQTVGAKRTLVRNNGSGQRLEGEVDRADMNADKEASPISRIKSRFSDGKEKNTPPWMDG